MNTCRIRCLTIVISLFLATGVVSAQEFPTATPEEVGMSAERLGYLTAALEEYVAEGTPRRSGCDRRTSRTSSL